MYHSHVLDETLERRLSIDSKRSWLSTEIKSHCGARAESSWKNDVVDI